MLRNLSALVIAFIGFSIAGSAAARAAELKPRCLSAYALIRSDRDGAARLVEEYGRGRSAAPVERKQAIRG